MLEMGWNSKLAAKERAAATERNPHHRAKKKRNTCCPLRSSRAEAFQRSEWRQLSAAARPQARAPERHVMTTEHSEVEAVLGGHCTVIGGPNGKV